MSIPKPWAKIGDIIVYKITYSITPLPFERCVQGPVLFASFDLEKERWMYGMGGKDMEEEKILRNLTTGEDFQHPLDFEEADNSALDDVPF